MFIGQDSSRRNVHKQGNNLNLSKFDNKPKQFIRRIKDTQKYITNPIKLENLVNYELLIIPRPLRTDEIVLEKVRDVVTDPNAPKENSIQVKAQVLKMGGGPQKKSQALLGRILKDNDFQLRYDMVLPFRNNIGLYTKMIIASRNQYGLFSFNPMFYYAIDTWSIRVSVIKQLMI
jgi:hypothetical protein